MKVLGVITARGGSKRIPRKNVKLLDNNPLISYVISAAKASCIDRLIVSTDDQEISYIAEQYGAEVPFKRPANISEDVPSEQVVMHAVEWVEKEEDIQYDIIVTMQPTTPFIESKDIDATINSLKNSKASSCFTSVEISQPPQWMFRVGDNGSVTTYVEGGLKGERGVVQALEKLVMPNGGVYATRRDKLFEQQAIIADPSSIVEMSRLRSVDIDEPIDWIIAEVVAAELAKG